jgi:hypothetical protein
MQKGPLLFCFSIVMALSLALLSSGAGAADVTLTPKLAVGAAYDDNIFFSQDNTVDSSIFTVSPGVELDYETLVSDLSLEADWDILTYQDESDLNRTNQYYRFTGERKIKERWETNVDLDYFRDTTLNTYLQETGRVIDRIERDYFNVGGTVAYNLTQVSGISAAYRYQTASYEDDFYSAWDRNSASLFFYHRLKSEVDRLRIGPTYSHRTNDFNEVDTFSLNLGWKRDWSDISFSDASIGARYANVKRNDGTEDDSWGVKANFELTMEGVANTTRIRYFHDLRTTVDGDDVNVDNFWITYRRRITERFSMGIEGRLAFSYKLIDQQADINDERYYWIEPNLSYRLTRFLGISLKYRYQNNVEFTDDGDITKDRNVVWLQLFSSYPIKL